MKEKISEFLQKKGFIKNEYGAYIYQSKDGAHVLNMAAILEDFVEYEEEKHLYASKMHLKA